MPKRNLTPGEAFELRQALHIATLDALVASRRWEPGELVFQGGTSLHLVFGSPRYSEDLDFLVSASLKLDSISEAVRARLQGTAWLPSDTDLTVSKGKDIKGLHSFDVTIGGPEVIGSVRVKVELWRTERDVLTGVRAVVAPVQLARGPLAGMRTYVPAAELGEIYADKVFALAARSNFKARDVFDLHWLSAQMPELSLSNDALRTRLATYPNQSPTSWIDKAFARREYLRGDAPDKVLTDLQRWLPSSWPLDTASVSAMVQTAVTSLEQGIDVMRDFVAEHDDSNSLEP